MFQQTPFPNRNTRMRGNNQPTQRPFQHPTSQQQLPQNPYGNYQQRPMMNRPLPNNMRAMGQGNPMRMPSQTNTQMNSNFSNEVMMPQEPVKKKGVGGLISNLLSKNKKTNQNHMMPTQGSDNPFLPNTGNNSMFRSDNSFPNNHMMAPKMMNKATETKKSSGLGVLRNLVSGSDNEKRTGGSAPSLTSILTNPSNLQSIMGNVNNIANATGDLMPFVNQYLPFMKKIPDWVSGLGNKETTENEKSSQPVTTIPVSAKEDKEIPKQETTASKPESTKLVSQPSKPKIYTKKHV